jgi:hypothetical protein
MPWKIEYLADQHLIECAFDGYLNAADLVAGATATIAAGNAHGTARYLCDCSGLSGGHSVFDLYTLAERLHELGMPRGAHEAVIVSRLPALAMDASFWETVCRNRGFKVRSFIDRASALAWLSETRPSLTGT